MRIAYLAAGAAGMYCGSCLHDNTLAAALLALGEDVVLVPIYTPIRTDERDVSEPRVFYGGINAWLQQKFAIFRRTPRWFDGWLDSPRILNLLAGRGASVDAAKLGDMTVSMLRGEEGNQLKELDKLVDWIVDEAKPEVVHLSNAMMVGLARRIKERGGPAIVCTLSGEDVFLDKLLPPYRAEAQRVIRERARDVDAFVALNHYYADYMADYAAIPRERIRAVPHGLDLAGHGVPPERSPSPTKRIGYFSRICHDKGLHLLIEAGELLAPRADAVPLEIHAAGYLGAADRRYLQKLQERAARGSLAGRFTYHGELDRPAKIAFLQSLDVFCVPAVYRESKGLPLLEAWANGVPAVVPNHGTYPELIADTGGGLLHMPETAVDIADRLAELLADPARAAAMGREGRRAVEDRYHAEGMARQTLAIYRQLVGDQVAAASTAAGI